MRVLPNVAVSGTVTFVVYVAGLVPAYPLPGAIEVEGMLAPVTLSERHAAGSIEPDADALRYRSAGRDGDGKSAHLEMPGSVSYTG
ncbi:MAG: hypothetical protein IPF41_11125 [Flavobacteriales bacterium]|nr:hypothetical protein [Flavobacteriales bacterium]